MRRFPVIARVRVFCWAVATVLLIGSGVPAHAGDGRVEAFAGYYFAEELPEDVSFGLRGAWESGRGWGLMLSYERFESDGAGYGEPSNVDGEVQHLELSYIAYPTGGGFELFSGIGTTDVNVDPHVAGASVDLDKASFSVHAGIAYRWDLGDAVYLRPELRARLYKVADETIDYTASIAFGFRWDGGQ